MRKLLLRISVVILLVGIADLPTGYYTLVRIIVCATAIGVLIKDFDDEYGGSLILFGIIAIVFNPILPIYLHSKGFWVFIDFVVAAIMLTKSFVIKPREE